MGEHRPPFIFSAPEAATDVPHAVPLDSSNLGVRAGAALHSMLASISRHSALGDDRAARAPNLMGRQRSAPRPDLADDSKRHVLAAARSFDLASSRGGSSEEEVIRASLQAAVKMPAKVGRAVRGEEPAGGLECQPDLATCPELWDRRGGLCYASPSYTGPCAGRVDFFVMGDEQKMAFARYCDVRFRCQSSCDTNFDAACPSLWAELAANVCFAPPEYRGGCSRRLDTSRMTRKDKHEFGVRCGARWPCVRPTPRVYDDVCPQGWSLQRGQFCAGPANYSGPCPRLAHLRGMGVFEQKVFEAACNVSWPEAAAAPCERDYAALCPYGWFAEVVGGTVECRAPLGYHGCLPVQHFVDMSPAQNRAWGGSLPVDMSPAQKRAWEELANKPSLAARGACVRKIGLPHALRVGMLALAASLAWHPLHMAGGVPRSCVAPASLGRMKKRRFPSAAQPRGPAAGKLTAWCLITGSGGHFRRRLGATGPLTAIAAWSTMAASE
eukprot:CAMPEP_0175327388 /NCGR_PEP_ID=MMETSP0093-20121207/75015_1 /TAXON_ID=311494 /ORGANISM="Alexandrium monilatum, Strain CCMP3105" /LENGTH=496 /DNA_ID=CAMNT_0016624407 /DNA_START=58 /DNA_END=1549 /DNA_ORIENTATION=+